MEVCVWGVRAVSCLQVKARAARTVKAVGIARQGVSRASRKRSGRAVCCRERAG